jgi:hypothetical protein
MDTESTTGQSTRAAARQAAEQAAQAATAAQQQAQAAQRAYQAGMEALRQKQAEIERQAKQMQEQYSKGQMSMEDAFAKMQNDAAQRAASNSLPPWVKQELNDNAQTINNLSAQVADLMSLYAQHGVPAAAQVPPQQVHRINHIQVPADAAYLKTPTRNAIYGLGGATTLPQQVPTHTIPMVETSPISNESGIGGVSWASRSQQGDIHSNFTKFASQFDDKKNH